MIAASEVRRIALALAEVVEMDHHGRPSFRVAGKIFCTLNEDAARLMVKLAGEHQHNFVQSHPGAIEPVPGYWGRKGSTYVDLTEVDPETAETLVGLAWSAAAPKRLARRP